MLDAKSDQHPQAHQLGWHGSRWTLKTISTWRSEMSWLWRGNPGSLRGWTSGTTSLATRTEWKLNKLLHTLNHSLNNSFSCLSAGLLLILECQQLKTIDGNNILDCLSKETNNSKCKTCSGSHWEKKKFFSSILWNYFKKELFELRWKLQRSKRKGNPLMPILSRIFPQKLLKSKNIWEFLSCGGERIHHSFTKQW